MSSSLWLSDFLWLSLSPSVSLCGCVCGSGCFCGCGCLCCAPFLRGLGHQHKCTAPATDVLGSNSLSLWFAGSMESIARCCTRANPCAFVVGPMLTSWHSCRTRRKSASLQSQSRYVRGSCELCRGVFTLFAALAINVVVVVVVVVVVGGVVVVVVVVVVCCC